MPLAGATTARTGDEMSGPVLLLAAFAALGPTGDASAVLAALTAASALGGPLLGIHLDRARHPGRLLAVALALYATGLLAVLTTLDHAPLPTVLLLAATTGLLGPALSGGWTAQLPRVARHLPRANTLDAMTYDAAALTGPALAAATAATLGPATAVLLAAGLITAALPAAWTLPPNPAPEHPTATPSFPPPAAADRDTTTTRPELITTPVELPLDPDRPEPTAAPPAPTTHRPSPDPTTTRPQPTTSPRGLPTDPGRPELAPAPPAPAEHRPSPDPTTTRPQPTTTQRPFTPHPTRTRPPRDQHPPPTDPENASPGRATGSVRSELASGLRALTSSPTLARATAVSVGASAGQGMLAACLPLLGERALGGASRGPLLLALTAVAALSANAALARRPHLLPPDAAVCLGALLQAAALALAATGRPFALVAAAALAGLGEGPQLSGLFAVRHREAPARLRAQVFTTGASLKITAFALGAALAGPIATHSVPAALLLAAALTAAATLRRPPLPRPRAEH
ncbi:MFS transporter [Kitasatospora sp. NPDC092948]|uniref:MFS transporter n=1 Tax=Kitasatospora sp. NPDC092948 TaxID=3364088 RepID=UPI00380CAB60